MKYFFLADGWKVGRVWATDGLWQETAWRRPPNIQRLEICLQSQSEMWWLYRVEDAVLMVEVSPIQPNQIDPATQAIGQVVLKRLISAEEVLERMMKAEAVCQLKSIQSVVK